MNKKTTRSSSDIVVFVHSWLFNHFCVFWYIERLILINMIIKHNTVYVINLMLHNDSRIAFESNFDLVSIHVKSSNCNSSISDNITIDLFVNRKTTLSAI